MNQLLFMVSNVTFRQKYFLSWVKGIQAEGRQRQKAACCERMAWSNFLPQLNLCETVPSGRGVSCTSTVCKGKTLKQAQGKKWRKGKSFSSAEQQDAIQAKSSKLSFTSSRSQSLTSVSWSHEFAKWCSDVFPCYLCTPPHKLWNVSYHTSVQILQTFYLCQLLNCDHGALSGFFLS